MYQPKTLLDAEQKEQLNKALRDVFTVRQFDQMLEKYLGIKREDIILEHHIGREELFGIVIEEIDRRGDIPLLLDAALKERPKAYQIFLFAQQFGLPIKTPTIVMERIIDQNSHYIDVEPWLEDLHQLLSQVCSIEEAGKHVGTGFLIGPCVIMTNYHVVEGLFNGKRLPTEITCRFDSRVMLDGTTVREGVQYHLYKKAWRIDCSPYHPMEFTMPNVEPSIDQLDYALLRLEDKPVIDQSDQPARRLSERGWIKPRSSEYEFPQDTPLYILHYPKPPRDSPYAPKVPLKFSMDTNTVLGENKNRTRVYYRTNTESGSSGAPCFTTTWDLVALHHAGDPSQKPQYNQGIPFVTILRRLAQENILRFLALDTSAFPDLPSAIPSSQNNNNRPTAGINTPSVFPQSTTFVIIPTSFTEQIKSALDTIYHSIEIARKPFASEGSIRRNQYKSASKNLQEVEKHLQNLNTLLSGSEDFPSYFPDRETIDTDISIFNNHRKALIGLLKDLKLRQNIQDTFFELEKSFNRIKKDFSETNNNEHI